MSSCASDSRAGRRLLSVVIVTGMAALLFYVVQNRGWLEGGNIALPKLLWLAYAILFWFCLPALIVLDTRTPAVWRRIYALFLVNMLLRAAVELFMMYVTNSWSPYYGIGHDLFTILLLFTVAGLYRKGLQRGLLLINLIAIVAMFVIEVGFVLYMLLQVSGGEHTVYFVPGDQQHAAVLQITWLVNILLTIYLYAFFRRWTRGKLVCTGGCAQAAD